MGPLPQSTHPFVDGLRIYELNFAFEAEAPRKKMPKQLADSVNAKRQESAIELLRSWREGDEQEQRETWEFLKRALEEDRLSDRKLFE